MFRHEGRQTVWRLPQSNPAVMELPKQFDNITQRVIDDLRETLRNGSKVSMAAASFSIYAFEALQRELEQVDELRFIFTSPTFNKERAKKQKREFYIPKLNRERTKFRIRQAFASPWVPMADLELTVQGQSLPRIYDNFVAQVSGIGEHKAGAMADIVALRKQITDAESELKTLERKMRREPQLDKQLRMNKDVKAKRLRLKELQLRLKSLQ